MKKNIFSYSLMVAMACFLSMGFVACSDDNNNSNSGDNEVINADQTDEAITAWAWVNVLTDVTGQADNWQSKTYTATIGVPSTNKQTARVIYVSNLADAKANFASIAGCDPDELSGTKTFSAGEFGTMQWNISAQGAQNIATVDVDSKLLPQLQQIIYCTEEQAPENGANITGNCYYRLGDVVKDKDGYYWVCVQPSFLGRKNNDSYWVNVFNSNPETNKDKAGNVGPGLPEEYIYSKCNKRYNNNTILLPTKLKMNRQQNYNLANLMWALFDAKKFEQLYEMDLSGLPMKYHYSDYLQKVCDAWKEKNIWEILFNRSYDQIKNFGGLNFFYNGYHWKIGSTAGVWIYKSFGIANTYKGSYKDDDKEFEMKEEGYGFDVRRYVGDPKEDINCASHRYEKMAPAKQFFGSETGYWVIRVATGKQLDSRYNVYSAMTTVDDVYTYNSKYNQAVGADAAVPVDANYNSIVE
jgi:hypothetical protein